MKKLKIRSYLLMIFSIVLICIVSIFGSSFAVLTKTGINSNSNDIAAGTMGLSLSEPGTTISIDTDYVTDEENMSGTDNYVEFTVTGTSSGEGALEYFLYFTEVSSNTITGDKVKLYITDVVDGSEEAIKTLKLASEYDNFNVTTLETDSSSTNYLLDQNIFEFVSGGTISKVYRIRLWGSGIVYTGTTSTDRTHTAKIEDGSYSIKLHLIGRQTYTNETPAKTIERYSGIKTLATDFKTETIGTNIAKSGLFAFTEGRNTDYFFRGYVNNNWVKFGKDASNNDMYWRIYRITNSGEIRMIYAGIVAPTSSTQYVNTTSSSQIGTSTFNSTNNRAEYVGYQYTIGNAHGKTDDSIIKTVLESWYTNNLADEDSYISSSNYCYDRTTYSGTVAGSNYSSGTGIGTDSVWFSVARRLVNESSWNYGGTGPSLVCTNSNDIYNLKIGLISVDEANLAGLKFYSSSEYNDSNNYLNSNTTYWTGSPFYYNNTAVVSTIDLGGYIRDRDNNNSSIAIRPVISLKSNLKVVTGTNGTYEHPYEFSLE